MNSVHKIHRPDTRVKRFNSNFVMYSNVLKRKKDFVGKLPFLRTGQLIIRRRGERADPQLSHLKSLSLSIVQEEILP